MDLYKIICPYCKQEDRPYDNELEGYRVVTCIGCDNPFVIHTVYTPAYQSYALVGIGQQEEPAVATTEEAEPAPEQQETLIADVLLEEQGTPYPKWQPTPGHKNGMYRIDGEYVEVRYLSSHPVRTTLADIHMLCEEKNPTEAINSLLGTAQDTRNTAALNFFIKAVKKGEVVL